MAANASLSAGSPTVVVGGLYEAALVAVPQGQSNLTGAGAPLDSPHPAVRDEMEGGAFVESMARENQRMKDFLLAWEKKFDDRLESRLRQAGESDTRRLQDCLATWQVQVLAHLRPEQFGPSQQLMVEQEPPAMARSSSPQPLASRSLTPGRKMSDAEIDSQVLLKMHTVALERLQELLAEHASTLEKFGDTLADVPTEAAKLIEGVFRQIVLELKPTSQQSTTKRSARWSAPLQTRWPAPLDSATLDGKIERQTSPERRHQVKIRDDNVMANISSVRTSVARTASNGASDIYGVGEARSTLPPSPLVRSSREEGRSGFFQLAGGERRWSKNRTSQRVAEVARSSLMATREELVKRQKNWKGYLDAISMSLILMNAIFMGVEAEVRMQAAKSRQICPPWVNWVNTGFAIAFASELVVKLILMRSDFFRTQFIWNMYDVVLVLSSLGDVIFEMLNLSFLRSLRIFRMVRATRVVRGMAYVQELRLMVASIVSSLPSLGWAFLLLFLLLYLFALFIMQGVSDYMVDNGPDNELIPPYGGLLPSLLSLFMSISGGTDWGDVLTPLTRVGLHYVPLFVVYITFVVFGVLNILTAVFIEASSSIIEVDKDLVVQQCLEEEQATTHHLRHVFTDVDPEDRGVLSKDKVDEVMSREDTRALLRSFGLDISKARIFFRLLNLEAAEEVSIDDLVCGLMRLRGGAKGVDVATMMYENKRLFQRLRDFMSDVDGHFRRLGHNMDTVEQMACDIHENVEQHREQATTMMQDVIDTNVWTSQTLEVPRATSRRPPMEKSIMKI